MCSFRQQKTAGVASEWRHKFVCLFVCVCTCVCVCVCVCVPQVAFIRYYVPQQPEGSDEGTPEREFELHNWEAQHLQVRGGRV